MKRSLVALTVIVTVAYGYGQLIIHYPLVATLVAASMLVVTYSVGLHLMRKK